MISISYSAAADPGVHLLGCKQLFHLSSQQYRIIVHQRRVFHLGKSGGTLPVHNALAFCRWRQVCCFFFSGPVSF